MSTKHPEGVREAPWDARALGTPAYEITALSPEVEEWLAPAEGFFSLKLPAEHPKGEAERLGFYYCDTLLQPSCTPARFRPSDDERCSLTTDFNLDDVLAMVPGSFTHDRFHKDKNISENIADYRYLLWLKDLHADHQLFAFVWEKRELAGFWGYTPNGVVVLHALANGFRGKGLAKFFWTAGCRCLFDGGIEKVSSSVSASNLVVINLYLSLGFSMNNAIDVYHLLNPTIQKERT